MRLILPPPAAAPRPSPPSLRVVREQDLSSLGALMHQAYAGTVDDEGETEVQACAEIARTFAGAYGPFDGGASWVYERDGRLLSAALLTRWEQTPFVAFSFTHPNGRNQGLARACLEAAIAELARRNERELRLLVTRANAPAMALYARLGFQEYGQPPT